MKLKELFRKYRIYILSVGFALAVGGLSGLISGGSMDQYDYLVKPPLSPPGWLFPIVWTILYILMGIAAAEVLKSRSETKGNALALYAFQLAVNFFWPIIYFVLGLRLIAFFWLLLLIVLVYAMLKRFCAISRFAGWLILPYFLWLLFAAYLNLGSYILNR